MQNSRYGGKRVYRGRRAGAGSEDTIFLRTIGRIVFFPLPFFQHSVNPGDLLLYRQKLFHQMQLCLIAFQSFLAPPDKIMYALSADSFTFRDLAQRKIVQDKLFVYLLLVRSQKLSVKIV